MAERGAAGRFEGYLGQLRAALGHADRAGPLRAYLTGLLLPGDRKSVEPMAAKIDPRHVAARHQSMHHFVAQAPWDAAALLAVARDYALAQLERHGPVAAWVVDDTAFPKKGTHSVGVARQYCGVLGKPENCQVAVTVSLVNATMSMPSAYRLYLPEAWVQTRARRREGRIPPDVRFQSKWEIALTAIDALCADDLPRAPVVADAGYGVVTAFRDALTRRRFSYAVGITAETTVWPTGTAPLPPPRWRGRGRPPTRYRRTPTHRPLAARRLAERLADARWRTVRWREGTRGMMQSRPLAPADRPPPRIVQSFGEA